MTATIVDDLVNWTIFAIILSDIAPSGQVAQSSLPLSMLSGCADIPFDSRCRPLGRTTRVAVE